MVPTLQGKRLCCKADHPAAENLLSLRWLPKYARMVLSKTATNALLQPAGLKLGPCLGSVLHFLRVLERFPWREAGGEG